MALSCGARCLKLTIFAFNFVFFMLGLLCVGMGVWFILDRHALHSIADAAEQMGTHGHKDDQIRDWAGKTRVVTYVGWAFVVGGGCICIIALMGCCGAWKEWRPLLLMYAFILMMLLAFEIAVGIYVSMNKTELEMHFKNWLKATIDKYDDQGDGKTKNAMKEAWDSIMTQYSCCGLDSNVTEFINSGWYIHSQKDSRVPPKCCHAINTNRWPEPCLEINRHKDGCYQKLRGQLINQHGVAIGLAMAVGVIEMFGIMMSICLCNAISAVERERDESEYAS